MLIVSAAPPDLCQEAADVSTPCRGTIVPYDMLRTLLACSVGLAAERDGRVLDAVEAEARLVEARQQEATQRTRAEGCQELLGECVALPSPRVAWWQRSEFVIVLGVVAAGAVAAVVVLAVDR